MKYCIQLIRNMVCSNSGNKVFLFQMKKPCLHVSVSVLPEHLKLISLTLKHAQPLVYGQGSLIPGIRHNVETPDLMLNPVDIKVAMLFHVKK